MVMSADNRRYLTAPHSFHPQGESLMRRRDFSKALLALATVSEADMIAPSVAAQGRAAPHYAQTAAESAAGIPINTEYAPGWISRYGNNLEPGTTDMSTALQNAVNANRGGHVYIDSLCLVAGVILSGPQYDGTQITCVGNGELMLKPNGGKYNFDGSIWSGIVVQDCDRVVLDLRWHGNRLEMTQYEGIHCVDLCGATNVHCRSLKFREIRSDGLYIDHLQPSANKVQKNSHNIQVDYLWAANSADDGRNACSVISCDGLTINEFHSYKVGGKIAGLLEPGGLDIEPNWPHQSVTDVVIKSMDVVTAGGFGLAIQGLPVTDTAARDWNCQRVTVGCARIRHTKLGNFLINKARDVKVNVDVVNENYYFGAVIDYADRVDVVISARHVTSGIALGLRDWVYDSNITCYISDYGYKGVGGVWSVGVGRTTIQGRLSNAVANINALGIQLGTNGGRSITQTSVVYSLDIPYDANLAYVVYNGGGTDKVLLGKESALRDCTMVGFPERVQANFDIPSYNCAGRNLGATAAHSTATASAPSCSTR